MKRSTAIAATVIGLSLALASEANAVPVTTSFTARITDSTGPVNGLLNLNFKIFDAATAGTMLWEEMHTGASADQGLVYVALGSIAPTTNGLDATVFAGGPAFLEVTVNGDVQSPRVAIHSVPYAIHAATADKLGTLAPGDVAPTVHAHNYAATSHTHDYAATTHTHNYAATSHTHTLPTFACVTVNAQSTTVAANTAASVTATCAAGYVVTGGGCRIWNGPTVDRRHLDHYISGNGFYCRQFNQSAGTMQINADARCCRVQ